MLLHQIELLRVLFFLCISCWRLTESLASPECSLPIVRTKWVTKGENAELQCRDSSLGNPQSYKWWVVSNPCELSGANELEMCGNDQFCTLPNSTYMSMESCTVCCSESSVSTLSGDTIFLCVNVGVCPVVSVTYPTLTTAGGTINVETVVFAKPRPLANTLSVIALYYKEPDYTYLLQETMADGHSHRLPMEANTYSFFHSFSVPRNSTTGQRVRITVDTSRLFSGGCLQENLIIGETQIIRVNRTVPAITSSTDGTPASPSTKLVCADSPTADNSLQNVPDRFNLDYTSLGIGIAVGVAVMMVLLLVVVSVAVGVMCHWRCPKSGDNSSVEMTGRHLLTATGTPATTPGDEKRVLGGSCSQETPATTPTENDTLLNGTASQLSSRNPPTTLSSEFPSSHLNTPAFMSAQFTGPPAAGRLVTGHPAPPSQPAPSPLPPMSHSPQLLPPSLPASSPLPPTSRPPQPPRSLQGPSYSNPSHMPPQVPHTHQDTRPSTLEAGYLTQGDAIYLSKHYNHGPDVMV